MNGWYCQSESASGRRSSDPQASSSVDSSSEFTSKKCIQQFLLGSTYSQTYLEPHHGLPNSPHRRRAWIEHYLQAYWYHHSLLLSQLGLKRRRLSEEQPECDVVLKEPGAFEGYVESIQPARKRFSGIPERCIEGFFCCVRYVEHLQLVAFECTTRIWDQMWRRWYIL